jgi:hypothetical protein
LLKLVHLSWVDFCIHYFFLLLVRLFYSILKTKVTFSIHFHRYLSLFYLFYLSIVDFYRNYSCLMTALTFNLWAKIYARKYYSYPHLFPSVFPHNYLLSLQFTSISPNETFQYLISTYYYPLLDYWFLPNISSFLLHTSFSIFWFLIDTYCSNH